MSNVSDSPYLGLHLLNGAGQILGRAGTFLGIYVGETPFQGVHAVDPEGEIIESLGGADPNWNALTNTPDLTVSPEERDRYFVAVGGTQDLGGGSETYNAGDTVVYTGGEWVRVPRLGSGVSSFAGRMGAVDPEEGDYDSSQINHYTGSVEEKLDELETNGSTRDTTIAGNVSAIAALQTNATALQTSQTTQDSAIANLQTGQSTQDTAIALNLSNITANTTAITANTNTISTLQATQTSQLSSLQTQIAANDTDITALNTAVAGKADTTHAHLLANITDAGNVAGLNYGTLLNTAAGQLNVDFSTVPLVASLDSLDEFPVRKSDGTYGRITKDNLFSQVLTGAGYEGVARVNGSVLEDKNGIPITDANGSSGRWYRIGTGGPVDLGSGILTLGVFDLIAYDNGAYDHIINNNAVTGVVDFNGRTGVIVPTLGDYATDLVGDDSTAGNANLTVTLDALLSQQATNTGNIATNAGNIATNAGNIAAIDTSNKVTKGGDDQAIVVGTNTVDTLELKTANAGRLWITGSGNVGFKVANPQTDFDFDGGVRFRNLTEQTSYTRFPVVDISGNFGWRAISDLLLRNNLATQADAHNGTDNTKWMSPLRVKEAIQNHSSNVPLVFVWAFRTNDYLSPSTAPISYNGIRYDYSNNYVAGLFTVPNKGLYSFNIRYCSYKNEIQHFASLGINGNNRNYDIFEGVLSPYQEYHATVDLILNQGDTVGVYCSGIVGVHGSPTGAYGSSFQVRLVRLLP